MVKSLKKPDEARKVLDIDELVGRLSKETGVSPEDVRVILRESFNSTREYIRREAVKNATNLIQATIGDVAW